MARSRRDDLVDAALALFRREGFHATGIDRVLAEAGVAKMTLYHHFRSKEELILAALRRQDEVFRNGLQRRIAAAGPDPRARLLALFDALREVAAEPGFSGCPFINASAEYADPEPAVQALAREHKRLLYNQVRELAREVAADDPERLAHEVCLLMDGVIVAAQVSGSREAVRRGREAARVLIAYATRAEEGSA